MSDFWHKLGCCVVEKPQPKKRRRRIDRSMIGEPMNFIHLTHIGSGDMAAGEGLPMVPYPCEQLGWWVSWLVEWRVSLLGCWVSQLGDRCCFWGAGSHGWVMGVTVGVVESCGWGWVSGWGEAPLCLGDRSYT
ncbi:CDC42 small effector protein 1 isoform 3-T3 [Morphnus guianensis]